MKEYHLWRIPLITSISIYIYYFLLFSLCVGRSSMSYIKINGTSSLLSIQNFILNFIFKGIEFQGMAEKTHLSNLILFFMNKYFNEILWNDTRETLALFLNLLAHSLEDMFPYSRVSNFVFPRTKFLE